MRRGTNLAAVLGLAVLVGAAVAGQRLLMPADGPAELAAVAPVLALATAPGPELGPEAPPEAAAATLAVLEPAGLQRLGPGGEWADLPSGAVLVETDRIRAVEHGRAVIEASDGSRIELVDEVEVSVSTLTRSLAELDLERGRLRADLRDGSEMALRVRSSGAVAEGRAGAFTVYADGAGMVAVASETAEVNLMAQETTVALASGQQSIVQAGRAPSDPEAIPEQVFLTVAWPDQRLTRVQRLRLRGRVEPGSEVRVAGRRALVRSDGAFETEVVLDAGPNRVAVSARDPAGRERSLESPVIVVRNRPPRLEAVEGQLWED